MDNEVLLWVIIFGGNAALVCIMEGGVFAKYFVSAMAGITLIIGFFAPLIWLLTALFLVSLLSINRRIQKGKN